MKNTKRARINLFIWIIADFIISFMPLLILLIINWKKYIVFNDKNSVTTTIGFIGVIVFMTLILLKKTKLLKGIFGWWLVTLIFFCLRFIVADIVAISFCASLGMTLSKIITNPFVSKYKRIFEKTENAELNAQAVNEQTNAIIDAINKLGKGRA